MEVLKHGVLNGVLVIDNTSLFKYRRWLWIMVFLLTLILIEKIITIDYNMIFTNK